MKTFRELRAHERKIKKAKAKKHFNQVDRLREHKPMYAGPFSEGTVPDVSRRLERFGRLFNVSALVCVVTRGEKARDSARYRREIEGVELGVSIVRGEKSGFEESFHFREGHLLRS